MTEAEFHWLSGLLEGEGCFTLSPGEYRYPSIKLQMTDRDVVERAAKLMGGVKVCRINQKPPNKPSYSCALTGARAVNLMDKLSPFMGQRRRSTIARVRRFTSQSYLEKMKRLGRMGD